MRREDISDALDMLDEEMLAHTDLIRRQAEEAKLHEQVRQMRQAEDLEQTKQLAAVKRLGAGKINAAGNAGKTKSDRTKTGVRQNKTFGWKKWGAMAAGLCLVCLAAIAVIAVAWSNSAEDLPYQGKFAISQGHGGTTAEDGLVGLPDSKDAQDSQKKKSEDTSPELQEPFVPISYLLASADSNSGAIKEMAAAYARIPIGEYTGIYEKVYSIDSAVLADSIGREADGAKDWHYISGHEDLQYLIREENQEYSLWKFGYFDSEEYPYSDVLQYVYQITSAEEITGIMVQPAKMDNTDEGKRIQKEIGTRAVTGRDEINAFYQVLCTMTCYGNNRWDLIDYGDVEAGADTGLPNHAAVWLGRYLTLVLDNGNEIDGLKYTAVSNMFYEFSGVAYNRLTTEQAESVSSILGIAKEQQVPLGEREPKQLPQQLPQQDSVFLLRAENTRASLEDVTELQTKVSNAMINHELPFVTSSAVYENPYRLHVTVTTNAEEELEKLTAMDEKGGILEIEYGAENRIELY